MKNYNDYSDLELIDHFIDMGGLQHPDPFIFRVIISRGLLQLVNMGLGSNKDEAKAIVRSRLARQNKYIGDPVIEKIAFINDRIDILKNTIYNVKAGEPAKLIELAEALIKLNNELLDFFKNDNKCIQI